MQTSLRKRLIEQMSRDSRTWDGLVSLRCAAGLLIVVLVAYIGTFRDYPIRDVATAQQMVIGAQSPSRVRQEVINDRHARFKFERNHKSFSEVKP